MSLAADAALEFDARAHEYRLDGRRIPGVSAVLETLGFNDFEHVEPAVLEAKRDLGTRVHAASAYYDRKTLDWSTVSDDVAQYLAGWIRFRDEYEGEIVAIERRLYDRALDTAGTLDRVFAVKVGGRSAFTHGVLVDIKIGVPVLKHKLQTAAYTALWNGTLYPKVTKRATCHLTAKGTYTLKWHDDLAGDLKAFAAARQLYEWRNKHGINGSGR